MASYQHTWISLLCFPLAVVTWTGTLTNAFTRSPQLWRKPSTIFSSNSVSLNLIPLTKFSEQLDFFSTSNQHRCCIDKQGKFTPKDGGEDFQLYLVEESDLPEVALFIVKAFGADAINLSSNEFSAFEKGLMEPALDFFNGYAALSAFAEVLWGLRIRQADRIPLTKLGKSETDQKLGFQPPPPDADIVSDISPPQLEGLESTQDKVEAANRKSLILVLARPSNNTESNTSKWSSIESNIDVIASVELRLQPTDAKIPFSLPWWDKIERRIAALFGIPSAKHLQPYLSTLCVDDAYRGRKIGRAMVRCLEDIATTKWGYSKMYLHVDADNTPALNLYKTEGYKDVGRRWNPFWAGKAAEIGYFYKDLN